MRESKTGANRNPDDGKIDYAHTSALVNRVMCEYMHKHKYLENGEEREPDNWKLGMPPQWYRKSLQGHYQDLMLITEGERVFEDGKEVTAFHATMGLKFNINGLIQSLMKGYEIDRKYTGGKLEEEFNKRFEKEVTRIKK